MYPYGQTLSAAGVVCESILTEVSSIVRRYMDILMVGCGWVSSYIATEMLKAGHQVWSTSTSAEKANQLAERGIMAAVADFDTVDAFPDFAQKVFDTVIVSVPITHKDSEEAVQRRFARLIGFLDQLSFRQSFF